MLLGDDVHGVVEGDDTQDVAALVANGDGHQVVLGHLLGDLLLVKVGRDPDDVAVGKIGEAVVGSATIECAGTERR